MAYQRAYVPMDTINITQGYGPKSGTHKLSYALDLAGKDTGKDNVYAPFDCKITKLYQPKNTKTNATTMWITSTKKVLCRNGYYGYLTMSITHPSEISKMKKGTFFRQGQKMCTEGKTGGASGNHIHMELAKGKTAGWSKKKSGKYTEYVILNKVKPEEYLFVKENAVVKDNEYKGTYYPLVKESEITKKVKGVPSEPLLVHKTPDYKKSSIIKNNGLLNGDDVIEFYKKGSMSYIYHYEMMGYTASQYLK